MAGHARDLRCRGRGNAGPAQLDLRAEYRRPQAVGSLAIALEISNLGNRRNQCCLDVEVEEVGTDDEAIVVEAQHWPRLLPSLSIRWEH